MKKIWWFIILICSCFSSIAQESINMQTSGYTEKTSDNLIVYDDGGKDNPHSASVNSFITVSTTQAGDYFRINIHKELHDGTYSANLRIYDGDSNSSTLLYSSVNSAYNDYLIYSTKDKVTIRFNADDDSPLEGFEIGLQERNCPNFYVSCIFPTKNSATLSWNSSMTFPTYVIEYVDTNINTSVNYIFSDTCTKNKFNVQTLTTSSAPYTIENLKTCNYLYYHVYEIKESGDICTGYLGKAHNGNCYTPPPQPDCDKNVPYFYYSINQTNDSAHLYWTYSEKNAHWKVKATGLDTIYTDSMWCDIPISCSSIRAELFIDSVMEKEWCYTPKCDIIARSCPSFIKPYFANENNCNYYSQYAIGVDTVTYSSISVEWDIQPTDTITYGFVVSWKEANDPNDNWLYDTLPLEQRKYTVKNLKENTLYTIRIQNLCPYCDNFTMRSIWTSINNCFDFINLYNPAIRMTWGTYSNPYDATEDTQYKCQNGYRLNDTNSVWFYYENEKRHVVCRDTNAKDNNTGNLLRCIPQGEKASIRLGNNNNGAQSESISYEYTVDTNKSNMLLLKYAVVMQDPNHNKTNQPRFTLELLDENDVVLDKQCSFADFYAAGDLGWNTVAGSSPKTIWKDWTTVGVDIAPYHQQTIRVRLTTYDCSEGAHYGYAYFTVNCSMREANIVNQCDMSDSVMLVAPEGFEYKWYKEGEDKIISTQYQVKVPKDNSEYYCIANFVGKEECNFTVYTQALSIIPKAEIEYSVDTCNNKIVFINKSYIDYNKNYDVHTYQTIENVYWETEDGQTIYGDTLVRDIAHNGKYSVKLYAPMSESVCVDTLTQYIDIDFFVDSKITGDSILCYNQNGVLIADDDYTGQGKFSYLWNNGQTTKQITVSPNEDTLYSVLITKPSGCTEELNVNVKVNPVYADTIVAQICKGEEYNDNGFTENETGIYCINYHTIEGCDSILCLNLTVNETYNDTIFAIGCDTGYYQGDFNVEQSGTYTLNLQSQYGCDSVMTLVFNRYDVFTDSLTAELYSGDSYTDYGFDASESGQYIQTYTDIHGCDSTYILDLVIIKLKFPNVVTPNGDGINDVFEIYGLLEQTMFEETQLYIYNRYGKQVFSKSNIKSKDEYWDPAATNTPTGTYFYRFIAKSKTKNLDLTGVIEVIY
ncbi:MAG: gliding motility-associated C-terminal domain-containing protein [Bacteroidales bacterium]|nr:gliding motility-associated C-terminal domain-containing protein [Bacteroidales bacterium]